MFSNPPDKKKQRDIICDTRRLNHTNGAKRTPVKEGYDYLWRHGGYWTLKAKETSRISCSNGAGIFVINEVQFFPTFPFDIYLPPYTSHTFPPFSPSSPPPRIQADVLKNPELQFFFSFLQTEEDKSISFVLMADMAREIALTCYGLTLKINGELKDKKEGFVVLISTADC